MYQESFLEENICGMKRLVPAPSVMLLNSLATFSLAQSDFQTWLTYNNQTRLSQKWGYTFSPNRQIELAVLYQYILQYQPALSDTEEIHSIRLTFLHQLDFR